MPLTKRIFHVSCHGDECVELANIIAEKTPPVESLNISIGENSLIIEMYGYRTDIRRAWEYIKRMVRAYRGQAVAGRGIKKYNIQYLVEKIHKTFPPRLLVEILSRRGYRAGYDGEYVETDADPGIIEELIEQINEITQRIRHRLRGTTTKYFVIAASILRNKEVEDVIEEAMNKGLLVLGEDNRLILVKEWRSALDEMLRQDPGGN